METKVNICDECKKQVAEDKCKICSKDICKRCRCMLSIGLFSKLQLEDGKGYGETNGIALGGCYICKICKKNLKILAKKEHNEIVQKLIDYVKNEFVINELESGNEDEDEKKKK